MNLKLKYVESIIIDMVSKKIDSNDQSTIKVLSNKETEIVLNAINDCYMISKELNPDYKILINLKNGDKKELFLANDEISDNKEQFWKLRSVDLIREVFHSTTILEDKEIQLLKLKQNNPVKNWMNAFLNGFGGFNKYILIESEYLFERFIYSLLRIEGNSKEKIVECIDWIISEFNRIDAKYDYFIMTDEREEIMDFISKGAIIAGLEKNIEIDKLKTAIRNW